MKEKNFVTERRIGIFSIDERLITNEPKIVQEFLSQFIIVKAEDIFIWHSIEYTAFSEKFPIVDKGMLPPHYCLYFDIDIKQTPAKLLKIKIQEID